MNDDPKNQSEATEGAAADEPNVEIPTHDHEMARLENERAHLEVQLQRALADLQNVRRRQRQEIDDSRQRVLEGLAQELLPVLDTFAMALVAYDAQDGSADPKALVDGVRMVRGMLTGALERHGLSEIRAAGAFDPSRHEAVAVEPSGAVPEGHIVRVLQAGYQLGDRVVRPSRVVVAGPKNEKESV